MNTEKLALSTLAIFAFFIASAKPSTANASGVLNGGGGGGAYVCRNSSSAITGVELVDLFELEYGGDTVVWDDTTPAANQVAAAIQKLKRIHPVLGQEVATAWSFIQTHKVSVPSDVVIDPPKDIDANIHKAGCPLEGMMYFDDVRERLLINQTLFDAQSRQTAFAASYLHESVYRALRLNYAAKDSRMARHITGCLFAADTESCLNLVKTKVPTDRPYVKCSDKLNTFFYYATGEKSDLPIMENQYKVVFTRINGAPLLYEASVIAASTDKQLTGPGGLYGIESDSITMLGLESLPIAIPYTQEEEASTMFFVSEPAISELGQTLNLYTDGRSCKFYPKHR